MPRRVLYLDEFDMVVSLTVYQQTGFLSSNLLSKGEYKNKKGKALVAPNLTNSLLGTFKWRMDGIGEELVYNPVSKWLVSVNNTAYPTIQLLMINPQPKSTRGEVVKTFTFAFGTLQKIKRN